MCGRYEIFIKSDNRDMAYIAEYIKKRHNNANCIRTGEIFPTNTAPVIAELNNEIAAELFVWGFPKFKGNGVIINARSETASEKPSFRSSLIERRCVIPSTGFYEWKHDGTNKKYKFNLPYLENLYMAGIWNEYNGERRYVILTAAANRSMSGIHDRMPVIIPKSEIKRWILDTDAAMDMLRDTQPELEAVSADDTGEQMSLW